VHDQQAGLWRRDLRRLSDRSTLAPRAQTGNVSGMNRRVAIAFALSLLVVARADASERTYSVTSFERIRVQGPFEVRLTTGKAPSARVEGDTAAFDGISVSIDGNTLTVRRAIGDGGQANGGRGSAPIITLATPLLRSALVTGGGRLAITGMKSQRADLAVNGVGALSVSGIATDQLVATVIGTGTMTLAGRAQRAQLLTNGSGTIAAAALDVNDLTVRLDGPGKTDASARFSATIINSGLGEINVAGSAACVVKSPAGGVVSCGKGGQR
jgi:hypothetical protein